jgi:hypothetical protein
VRLLSQLIATIMRNTFQFHKEKLLETAQLYLKGKSRWSGTDNELEQIRSLSGKLAEISNEPPNNEWLLDLFELNLILNVFKLTGEYTCNLPGLDRGPFFLRYLRVMPNLESLIIPQHFQSFDCKEDCLEAMSHLKNLRQLTM